MIKLVYAGNYRADLTGLIMGISYLALLYFMINVSWVS